MIVTENLARNMWCPFVRLVLVDTDDGRATPGTPAGFNRPFRGDDFAQAACRASDCMAWRAASTAMLRHRKTGELKSPEPYNTIDWERIERPDPERGYCGLAGAPQ